MLLFPKPSVKIKFFSIKFSLAIFPEGINSTIFNREHPNIEK